MAGNGQASNWIHCKFGQALRLEYGKALKRADRNDAGAFNVYGSSGIVGKHDAALVEGPAVIVGRKGSVGSVFFSEDGFWPIDTTYYVTPPSYFDPKYLAHYLGFLDLHKLDTSTAVPGLNRNDAYAVDISVPPLKEQCRIVAKIEELFSELDNGVESLKAARTQVKTYRQSLLKTAFEGRLTEQWRLDNAGEIETADEFLQRVRVAREADDEAQLNDWKEGAAKRSQDGSKKPKSPRLCRYESGLNEYTPILEAQAGLPGSWSWVRLSWVLARKPQNGRSVKSKPGGFPVLTLTALHGNALDISQYKEGDWGVDDARPYVVNEGDFLIARGNGSKSRVGRGARALRVEKQVAYPDTMIRVSPDERWMQTRFLSLLWESRVVRDQIESSARTTAGIYKINQKHINDFVVPLPHKIEEQEYIADLLETALSACYHIEELIEYGLKRAEVLRQSVLKRAFEGKLVSQDPDDEPASALLERIRTEQEETPKPRGRRRKANA